MKHIALHTSVIRCRPQQGFSQLLNDCGHQSICARRLAANLSGAQTHDLSRYALSMGTYVGCQYFLHWNACESARDPVEAKELVKA